MQQGIPGVARLEHFTKRHGEDAQSDAPYRIAADPWD